jgi:hypothetical protein
MLYPIIRRKRRPLIEQAAETSSPLTEPLNPVETKPVCLLSPALSPKGGKGEDKGAASSTRSESTETSSEVPPKNEPTEY